ncbi:hypothetical protein D3C78_1038150 [compost metagenome]
MNQPLFVGAEYQGAEVLLEKVAGFVGIEGQLDGIDLDHVALHAQTAQAQRWRGARGNGDMQVGRAMIQQLLHQAVGGWRLHMMKVIHQQMQFFVDAVCGVGNDGDQGVDRLLAAIAVQPVLFDGNPQTLQRLKQIREEAAELPIVEAERDPGHVQPGLHQFQAPLREQDGLAEACPPGNQRCAARLRLAQAAQQLATDNVPSVQARWRELGGDQQIAGVDDICMHY